MSFNEESIVSHLQGFIQNYVVEEKKIYYTQLEEMLQQLKNIFYIDIDHLDTTMHSFKRLLLETIYSENFIACVQKAALKIMSSFFHIEELSNKTTAWMNRFNRSIDIQFINPPESNIVNIKDFDNHLLYKFVTIQGIIIKISPKTSVLKTAHFECRKCLNIIDITVVDDEFYPPSFCPFSDDEDKDCRGNKFKYLKKGSIFTEFRKLFVQESPEEVIGSRLPEHIIVYTKGFNAKKCKAGDLVQISGIAKIRASKKLSFGSIALNDQYLEANHIMIFEESSKYNITEEDKLLFQSESQKPDFFDKIAQSIAPQIFGMDFEKRALVLSAISGTFGDRPKKYFGLLKQIDDQYSLKNFAKIRALIHIFLLGDPSTGKSDLLKSFSRLIPKHTFSTGRGSSGVGLTAAITKDQDSGYILQAGDVVIADGGIAFIDELDKINESDISAFHECMADMTVTISKVIRARLNARTTIIACGNPDNGTMNRELDNALENTSISTTILNRFDLIFPIFDTTIYDEQISQSIIDKRKEIPLCKPNYNDEFLIKYFKYAKTIKSYLDEESAIILKEFYIGIRKLAIGKKIPIATRQFEGLIRLTEAKAKSRFSEIATKEDAEFAIKIFENYYYRIAFDEKGEFNSRLAMGYSKKQHSKKDSKSRLLREILEFIKEKYNSEQQLVDLEDIKQKFVTIKDTEIEVALDHLKQEGTIYCPRGPDQYRCADN